MSNIEQANALIPAEPPPLGYKITRTKPDQLIRHDISDEELDMLCEGRKDHVWEGMWTALGVALGTIPTSLANFGKYQATGKIGSVDLATLIICCVAIVLTAVLLAVGGFRGRGSGALKQQIRERTTS